MTPVGAYYLFIFFIVGVAFVLFLHLALVQEVVFFQNIYTNGIIILSFVMLSLVVPFNIKEIIGQKIIPIFKMFIAIRGGRGSFDLFESEVQERARLRVELDSKIKSNTLLYSVFVVLIIISIIGFIGLMIYSATF